MATSAAEEKDFFAFALGARHGLGSPLIDKTSAASCVTSRAREVACLLAVVGSKYLVSGTSENDIRRLPAEGDRRGSRKRSAFLSTTGVGVRARARDAQVREPASFSFLTASADFELSPEEGAEELPGMSDLFSPFLTETPFWRASARSPI